MTKLKKQILGEIGLSENYSNAGEDSFTLVKNKALEKLPIVIGKLSDQDKCAPLNPSSLKLLEIISGVENEKSIDLFQDSVSQIIDAHINLVSADENTKRKHFAELHSNLVEKNIGYREKKK